MRAEKRIHYYFYRMWRPDPIVSAFTFFIVACLLLISPHCQAMPKAHQDVWLRNELGEHITASLNSSDPYSPKKTCGGCHSYSSITLGGHFQQGFYQATRKKWPAFGLYRTGLDLSALPEPVAAKTIRDNLIAGLSAYDWPAAAAKINKTKNIFYPAAGWFMPGGGPLEYGRDRAGKPDLSTSLAQREAAAHSKTDGDYSSRFTPDRLSHFRESGVIEADCLLCHSRSYSMYARNAQISARNYRWAATAGAGLGLVRGAVFTFSNPSAGPGDRDFLSGKWNFSIRPAVEYRWADSRLFSPDGKLKGTALKTKTDSASCLLCHGLLDAARTGTTHDKKVDVHAGLQCTGCHELSGKTKKERLRHVMAGDNNDAGKISQTQARTCESCHAPGQNKSRIGTKAADPRAIHARRFPRSIFHFYVISCTGCHATTQPPRGGYLFDRSTGIQMLYAAEAIEKIPGPESLALAVSRPWRPWIVRHNDGSGEKYFAGVPRAMQWFGVESEGMIKPLRLDVVEKALAPVRLTTVEVNGTENHKVKARTVAGEEETVRALQALGNTGIKNPVFVSDKVYRLDKGKLAAGASADLRPFLINHDIGPRKTAYGAKGCRDCHADSPRSSRRKGL